MAGDTLHRRPSYLTGCMSPSCVPVHEEYSRIPTNTHGKGRRNLPLRKLLRKIVNESRISICGPQKPINFRYDAVSYSKNFDEGSHRDDEKFTHRGTTASDSRFASCSAARRDAYL